MSLFCVAVSAGADDGGHLGGRLLGVGVDDDVVELVLGGDLGFGDLEPPRDRRFGVGGPSVQATSQFADRRRRHEDQPGLRDRRSDGPRALQLDLEDDIIARRELGFYVAAQRAVQVAPVVYPFEELPGGDGLAKLGRA